ncbi:MAG: hypothetical protein ACRC50_14365 [Gaiella sp.]
MARGGRSKVRLAFALFAAWSRLPPRQRRAVLRLTRRHGPRLAVVLLGARRRRRRLP